MSHGSFKDLLKHRGFHSFLWTQFLGALNDCIYKIVVSMMALDAAAQSGGGSGYLPLASAVFSLPFLLFSGYSGYFADVYSKRSVIVIAKFAEIIIMGLAFCMFFVGKIEWMLAVLFLMAAQSTLFSPAKYGILPEMLPDRDLSRANGLLEMSTFMAIVLGTSFGSMLFAYWKGQSYLIGLVVIAIAVIGFFTSLGVTRVPASGAVKKFSFNPWGEIITGTRRLYALKSLWLTVMGISYFMFLGQLLNMNMMLFSKEVLGSDDVRTGLLLTFLAVGIGTGSVLAGRLSGEKVELGLVPLGGIGMGIFSFQLAGATESFGSAAFALSLLAVAGGFFIVPLNAFLQQRSGRDEKGRCIATSNFISTAAIVGSSAVLWSTHDVFKMSPDRLVFWMGCVTIIGTLYAMRILPDFLIRFSLWLLTHTVYKIRIAGQENVPSEGPALLVCNHASFVDAFLVAACVQRFIRFMVHRKFYEIRTFTWLLRLMHAIPISADNPKRVLKSLEQARKELQDGEVVCIFVEGAMSRTGNLLPFKRGFERIVRDLDVPVIPVHLDRVWGSIFSFKDNRYFWKWPRRLPYPVTVSFGAALPSGVSAQEVRQTVIELGTEAVNIRREPKDLLDLHFIRMAKRRWFADCMADSTGKELTRGQALVGSLLLAKWIGKHRKNDRMIGILLPASVGGALANIAALIAGKIPVNLNFAVGHESMLSAVNQCEIKTVLTSKAFLERTKIEPPGEPIYMEDLLKQTTSFEKLQTALLAFLCPTRWIHWLFGGRKRNSRDLATILFSSGTTGEPKGVMLSHHNILSNIEGFSQVFQIGKADCLLGVLPFFHAFGLTGTLWFPIWNGFRAVYHSDPRDARIIGHLARKYTATVLISTPTLYGIYLRKCSKEDFAMMRYTIAGAERLRETVATGFREKIGIDLLEGYGCTEMSPVVSVNVPNFEDEHLAQTGWKPGTVGHPIPGICAKVVHPETGEFLPPGEEGLLLVKGANRMVGYLNQP
ncbi:MAG TPA: MFS transporter, partial [bacterium]|nr:MFS transporter [bacterium]